MPISGRILVVEDEASMREFLEILLRRHKHEAIVVDSGEAALEQLDREEFDLVITDLKMPGVGGLQILERTKQRHPQTEVVIVTAFATAETAIAAMKQGAYDYVTKPFKVDEIVVTVERALEKRALVRENVTLREELRGRFRLDRMVGRSPVMQQLFGLIQRVAATRTSLVILGESGTGKELVARAVHSLSDRAEKPFVAVNCGAIPETLMESELFGHVKGAFTGATRDKGGLFSAADGGTLFLDEIAELPPALQVKLLRALQERRIKPVGAVSELEVDVRIIAASNRDLEQEVASERFRSDLYYRLNVIALTVPPLRDRPEDIPLLAEHFMRRYAAEMGRPVRRIAPEALSLLCTHHYPGNVRELENLVERAVTLAVDEVLDVSSLPTFRRPGPRHLAHVAIPPDGLDLDQYMGTIEKQVLTRALEQTGGNRTEAAHLLRITLRSMRYRLAKYGIEVGGE